MCVSINDGLPQNDCVLLCRSYWLVGLPVAFLLGFTAHMGVSACSPYMSALTAHQLIPIYMPCSIVSKDICVHVSRACIAATCWNSSESQHVICLCQRSELGCSLVILCAAGARALPWHVDRYSSAPHSGVMPLASDQLAGKTTRQLTLLSWTAAAQLPLNPIEAPKTCMDAAWVRRLSLLPSHSGHVLRPDSWPDSWHVAGRSSKGSSAG